MVLVFALSAAGCRRRVAPDRAPTDLMPSAAPVTPPEPTRSPEPGSSAPSAPPLAPDESYNKIYSDLADQLGVDTNLVRVRFARTARDLKRATGATAYEQAIRAYISGNFGDAEVLARRAADEAGKSDRSTPKNIVQALEFAGLAAHQQSQLSRALKSLRAAEKLLDATHDPEDGAEVRFAIGNFLLQKGEIANAEAVLRRAAEVRAHEFGAEHPYTLRARGALASALLKQKKFSETRSIISPLLPASEAAFGKEAPETLKMRANLAAALRSEGSYPDAEAQYRALLPLQEKVLGPASPDTLATCVDFALVLARRGKADEARQIATRVAETANSAFGPADPTAQKYIRMLQEMEAKPTPSPSVSAKAIALAPIGPSGAIYAPMPEYPAMARHVHSHGSGYYELRVRPDGRVDDARILQSARDGALDSAALSALRAWRFRPGSAGVVRVPVTFSVSPTASVQIR